MTHYATLGVGEQATSDEIKRAYRKLASQHHPDKGGDTAKFQEIQTAYDTLIDTGKRQQYDMQRQGGGMGGPGGVHFHWNGNGVPPGMPPHMQDIFSQFGFGNGDPFAQFRQQGQPRRNKDLRVRVDVPLSSTFKEQKTTISVQTTNGHRETVEVQIPRGVAGGTTIKYPELGDNLFNTLPRGDLYVEIGISMPENVMPHGLDLHTRISVNCLTAIVGGEATLSGFDGSEFSIVIPAGTQPGVKFRLAKQGMYQMNTDNRGDMYVEMLVFVPKNLNPDQLTTINSILNSQ
jgi:DnaJ-class molecular chaperone